MVAIITYYPKVEIYLRVKTWKYFLSSLMNFCFSPVATYGFLYIKLIYAAARESGVMILSLDIPWF